VISQQHAKTQIAPPEFRCSDVVNSRPNVRHDTLDTKPALPTVFFRISLAFWSKARDNIQVFNIHRLNRNHEHRNFTRD
jgi:hypothetical protein